MKRRKMRMQSTLVGYLKKPKGEDIPYESIVCSNGESSRESIDVGNDSIVGGYLDLNIIVEEDSS